MVKVAIITRTKDRPLFLKRALESVSNQTFKDFTHVIVNDGGDTDILEKIIASADIKHDIQLFHRPTASGAPDTIFNESIDRVDSEYFAIHDDDDTWHPEFLQQMVTTLDSKADLGAAVARADKVMETSTGGLLKRTTWMDDVRVISLYRQCIDNQFTPIATVFRRSVYIAVGKFDDTLPVVGDWEFGIRLLSKYDADFVDPGYALANYHHRKKNGTSQDAVSSNEKHRYYTNLVMNRYLRQELAEGRLGVGYIMSQLKYNQSNTATLLKRFLPLGVVNRIKRRVSN